MSIKIENLKYVYMKNGPYEKEALSGINLTIEDGEFVGLIGHTGSGKSTLIQHLNGLLKPSEGTVFLDGQDIFAKETNLKEIRSKVGLVFQYPEYQLFEDTVAKDVAFGPKNYGLDKEEIDSRVRDAVKMVGLSEEILDKSPFELSGGQKRRVAIAGVLAMNPQILVLDEPAAGLDPYGREQILSELRYLHETRKITVILVSHSMEDIARYAGRIVVMHKGKIVMDGTPAEIFSQSEKLEEIRLDVPQVTKILDLLAQQGYQIPKGIFSVQEAASVIKRILS